MNGLIHQADLRIIHVAVKVVVVIVDLIEYDIFHVRGIQFHEPACFVAVIGKLNAVMELMGGGCLGRTGLISFRIIVVRESEEIAMKH